MKDIIKARALFKKAGLAFPVLPKKLAEALKEKGKWLYSTRRRDGSPYFLDKYLNEDDKTKIGDYAVVSHDGYGINSYAIQYYLVYGPLRMFLFFDWGGVYGDSKKDATQIKECFGLADKITKAASKKLRSDSQLTVVATDFYGNYWSPHDKRGTVIRREDLDSDKTPQQVLGEVLDWLEGIKISSNSGERGTTPRFRSADKKKPKKTKKGGK